MHDSKGDLSEKNEVICRDRGYFEAKSKDYDATIKRVVKEHLLGMSDVLRNRSISFKRAPRERVYAVIKKIFKARKVLFITVQRVNLKMLCTDFFYNLYQLMALKIKRVFLE